MVAASAIPSLPALPRWLADSLDVGGIGWGPPMPPKRRGIAAETRALADAYAAPMASPDPEITRVELARLRLRTIVREEGQDEAKARFRELCADLADVPPNVLADACDRYVRTPGRRFFPTAGELRQITDEIMATRVMRAYRLRLAAEAAAARERHMDIEEQAKAHPLTDEAVEKIYAEAGLRRHDAPAAREVHVAKAARVGQRQIGEAAGAILAKGRRNWLGDPSQQQE